MGAGRILAEPSGSVNTEAGVEVLGQSRHEFPVARREREVAVLEPRDFLHADRLLLPASATAGGFARFLFRAGTGLLPGRGAAPDRAG